MRAARACFVAATLSVVSAARALPPPGRNAGSPAGAASAASADSRPAPTPAAREAARALSTRGYELFEHGDCEGAVVAFHKAEELIHAPMHWLYIARCSAKLGK